MSRTYLIDGYNLLHALGFLHPQDGAHALERARLRLLHFLVDGLGGEAVHTSVVFDAAKAPRRTRPVVDFKGITVQFAIGADEADDLIETLIHDHPSPRHDLVVVSSDHRLLHAAQRSAATGWTCNQFLDYLDKLQRNVPPTTPRPEKPSRTDTEYWLRQFGDLADDPGFKEIFDPYPFDE
jgi:uncharacterized protein